LYLENRIRAPHQEVTRCAVSCFGRELIQMNLDTERLKRQMAIRFTNGARLAPEVGISKQALYRILRGESQPSPNTFKKLCEVLECEPQELLKEL